MYRSGDPVDPSRREGKSAPHSEDLPEQYQELLDWYKTEYDKVPTTERPAAKSRGATAETLMRLMGRINREDADELTRIIDDCCGRVDANEW